MTMINIYIVMMLSILLLLMLATVIFSAKHMNCKKYDEDHNILVKNTNHQAYAGPVETNHQVYIGLTNINLSCFFNACMQMLFSLEEFRSFVENSNSERMPTVRAIGSLFRDIGNGKRAVENTVYYNTIIESIGSADIIPNQENCASEFLELVIDKIVKEEADTNNISMNDLSSVSIRDFEEFRQRLITIRLFGILTLSTDHRLVGADNNDLPLQIAWYIRTRACESMQHTFNTILHGDIDYIPTRMVVHNRSISKYLILNFGPEGFSMKSVKWIGNGEVQVGEFCFALVAMILFRGNVRNDRTRKSGGHYMSYAKRNGVWYLFDDTRVKKKNINDFQEDLTVTSAVFERIEMYETV